MSTTERPISYKDAGVDIDEADALIDAIRPLAASTSRDGCLGEVGGFGALFEMPSRYQRPVLVSGTDGVGTKLKLAFATGRHDTIGIDLVAMCANDVLSQGAEPLFFLDYFATGQLERSTALAVVRGISEGCRRAGAALIGGETAEMPGMYRSGEYDLAGFCVGVVERDRILNGSAIRAGDAVIGIASSGAHSNGYSLIRKLLDLHRVELGSTVDGVALADRLLEPTRIYVKPVLSLLKVLPVHGIAHITGGGLPGNLKRILPKGHTARIDTSSWEWPGLFHWLGDLGRIEDEEMYRTFNCGVGMTIVLPQQHAEDAVARLCAGGETAWLIGEVVAGGDAPAVLLK